MWFGDKDQARFLFVCWGLYGFPLAPNEVAPRLSYHLAYKAQGKEKNEIQKLSAIKHQKMDL